MIEIELKDSKSNTESSIEFIGISKPPVQYIQNMNSKKERRSIKDVLISIEHKLIIVSLPIFLMLIPIITVIGNIDVIYTDNGFISMNIVICIVLIYGFIEYTCYKVSVMWVNWVLKVLSKHKR